MRRIYRYVLVAVMIALISWGVWYVFSYYRNQSTYEDGVLVKTELRNHKWREGEGITYGTGYNIY